MREKRIEKALKDMYVDRLDKEVDRAKNWFEKTFKDIKMSGQLLKLEEELREIRRAPKEEEKKELADVLIVIGGLRKFNSVLGNTLFNLIVDRMSFDEVAEMIELVNDKMIINKCRKWYKTKDGRYRHVKNKNGDK